MIEENEHIYNQHKDAVPNEFIGYVSSFAVSVALSGPAQALTFYESQGKAKFHREEIVSVMTRLMEIESDLSTYMRKHPEKKEKLLACAVALKEALRVFNLKKEMELW